MPSSRSLFQSTCRGFICQSCVSKLLYPRPPWQSRNIRTRARPKVPRARLGNDPKSQSGIKYFDEYPDGTREEIDFDKNAALTQSLDERIAELEKQLEDVKAGKEPEVDSQERDIQETLSQLTDEERKELLKVVDKVYDRQKELATASEPHPTYDFTMEYEDLDKSSQIRIFLRLLKTMALGTEHTPEQQRALWKQYSSVRTTLRLVPDRIPDDIWDFLWTVFAKTAMASPEKLGRLKFLAQDMEFCGKALSDTQMIVYLEAWYYSGQFKSAVTRWRSLVGKLGKRDSPVFKEFWTSGIRMLSLSGCPEEAIDAAVALFQDAPDADARAIIPIIDSMVGSNDDRRAQKAWLLYKKLRMALAGTMTVKDYDAVVNSFLKRGLQGLALGAFRDMMMAGNLPKRLSTPRLENFVEEARLIGPEVSNLTMDVDVPHSTTSNDIDWKPFEALAYLPPHMKNKFFFGKWIKKLLGEGQVNLALQVIDMMQIYQIRPAPIQLNGVIGALLRSNTVKGHNMGEKLGWDMIKARSNFLAAQRRIPDMEHPLRPILTTGKTDYLLSVGSVQITPPATQETVALLIESYRRRGLHSYVVDLWNVLKMLQLRPTTWILNQLLLSYHRADDYDGAKAIYRECVARFMVKPDLDTVKWIWLLTKQRRTQDRFGVQQETVRKLFASTMPIIPKSIVMDTEKTVLNHIYETVIQTFGLADDQIGTAIALQVFKKGWGLYPTEAVVQKIVTQLAATNMGLRTPRQFVTVAKAKPFRAKEINELLQRLMQQEAEDLMKQGIDINKVDKGTKVDYRIRVLTGLLRSLWETKQESAHAHYHKSPEDQIGHAVRTMGVPHMMPWEANESNVSND